MKEVRVFVFEVHSPSSLTSLVYEILEFSVQPVFQLHRASGFENLDCITQFDPHLIILTLSSDYLKETDALMPLLEKRGFSAPVIAVIEGDNAGEIVRLLKAGIIDFITPPLKAIDLLPRIWRLLEHQYHGESLTYTLKETLGLKQLVGECPVFIAEIEKIPLVAKCDTKVLITGETGTGKELFARAVHYLSPRANKPFIPVNCGAIPPELMENELFGHVEGAFTGASKSYLGLIHEADGGTLFLDEIGSLHLPAQAKLLRFLQDKEYRQLGSQKVHQADIRVIAASNADLEKAVLEGKFRRDLFYRLNIFPFVLPPLRERKEDIPLLAHHFLTKYAAEFHTHIADLSFEAMQKLQIYEWPGNVRELENVIERAVVLSKHTIVQSSAIVLPRLNETAHHESFQKAKSVAISKFEVTYIQGLLSAHKGNITRAARAAQKNRRAFWELIRKHNIDVQSFTSGPL